MQVYSRFNYGQSSPQIDSMGQDEFYKWFAGITDGEGCMYARLKPLPSGNTTVYCEFKIALRIDDKPLLDSIQRRLNVGMVHRVKAGRGDAKAQAVFRVIDQDELYHTILPIFSKYSLNSKKQNDFDVWKKIVTICATTNPVDHISELAPLVNSLKSGRKQFVGQPVAPGNLPIDYLQRT